MRRLLKMAVLLFVLHWVSYAQRPVQTPTPPPAQPVVMPCPPIGITGPKSGVKVGETIKYSARVDTKDNPLSLEFRWSVNPTTIFAGQGGPEIEFERPARDTLTVMLEVVGLPANCQKNATETASWEPTPVAIRLDQYIGPLPKIADSRLKRIVDSLRIRPESQLFITLEFITDAGEADAKQKGRVIAELLDKSGVDSKRVSYALGKTSRERVLFWLIPAGAEFPKIEK